MKKIALLLVLLLLGTATGLAEVYRWTDDDGKVVFGDKPPKNKAATAVRIEDRKNVGTRFATPKQIKDLESDIANTRRQRAAASPSNHVDPYCRRYLSELNRVEIFLEHSDSPQDRLKARDLRKLIKKECSPKLLNQKFADGRCTRYRKQLSKTQVFLEHSPNPLDEQRVKDLQKQIARECR